MLTSFCLPQHLSIDLDKRIYACVLTSSLIALACVLVTIKSTHHHHHHHYHSSSFVSSIYLRVMMLPEANFTEEEKKNMRFPSYIYIYQYFFFFLLKHYTFFSRVVILFFIDLIFPIIVCTRVKIAWMTQVLLPINILSNDRTNERAYSWYVSIYRLLLLYIR
jgi:hypothetical protein